MRGLPQLGLLVEHTATHAPLTSGTFSAYRLLRDLARLGVSWPLPAHVFVQRPVFGHAILGTIEGEFTARAQ